MTQRLRDESAEARPGGGAARAPSAEKRPVTVDPFRRHPHRRLRLAPRRQLAAGDARSGGARRPTSAPISRPRTPGPRPRWPTSPALKDRARRRDAGAHQGGRLLRPVAGRPLRLRHPLRARRRAPAADPHRRDGGDETVLLDANALAEGKAYFHLGGSAHSPDHRLLAYAVDDKGSEYFEIRIRDLETGEDLADRIPDTSGDAGLGGRRRAPSSTSGSTTTTGRPRSSANRSAPTRRRTCSSIEEANPGFFVGVGKTQSDRFIVIDSHDHETSEVRCPRRPTIRRRRRASSRRGGPAEKYDVDDGGGLLLHPHQCRRRRGLQDRHRAGRDARPRELARPRAAPARPADPLASPSFKDWLVRLEREDGLPRIVIRDLADRRGARASPSTRRPIRSA